jgi:glyoxylase-like metal-dependent hydrolase (beta-lactamase superfamily II)
MLIESFPTGPIQANCTLIGDHESHTALVIDPGYDAARIQKRLEALGLTVSQILLTHGHLDHVGAAFTLKRLTGAPVLLHRADLPLLQDMETQAMWMGMDVPEMGDPDAFLEEEATVGLERYPAVVLHTPGHSPGSVCFYFAAEKLLVAGDTLFAGSIGRTDLWGGSQSQIAQSIHTKLLPLDDETRVIAGHGPETTIGRERRTNPYLQTNA